MHISAAPNALRGMFYPPYCAAYYFLMKYSAPLWRVRDSPYEKRVIFIRSMRLYKDNLNDSNVFYLLIRQLNIEMFMQHTSPSDL